MIELRDDRAYIERFLKIRTKDGEIVPFRLNQPQQRLYEAVERQEKAGKPVRIIILKARQMGFSTLTEALLFKRTATRFNAESLVVAHKDEATNNLFRMSKRFYEHLPPQLQPMLRGSNAQELLFDAPANRRDGEKGLGSRMRCATAGGKGVGRSYTLQCVHMSEFAFWPGDKLGTYVGIMQAVPDKPGTMVIIESTANGYEQFKELWDKAVEAERDGQEGFIPIFFPWFEMEEYRREVPEGFRRTAEEEELAAAFGLDDAQLCWRRWCIAEQCGGDMDLFHQEYPATPDEAFIATGRCAFNKAALVLRREAVRQEVWERGAFRIEYGVDGRILRCEWAADEKGPIRVRKRPEEGVPYVIGGDTAGTGSDSFVGQVLDNRTGEQVAVLQHQFGERQYAEQMYCLGRWYNTALIGIETNYSTYPERKLEELGYPKLYVRERVDTYTGKLQEAYGFETTPKTRPIIIDGLKDVAKYSLECICDYETLGEMLTFVYDEKWKPQAEQGEHDDLVLALAIAHFIRPQQAMQAAKREDEGVEWTRDMWEDYRRADEETRKYLLAKWGKPRRR